MMILASKGGAVGNRLWAFAHLIATATEHDLRVADVAFDEYAACFEGTRHDLLCRFPPARRPWPGGDAPRLRRLVFDSARVLAALLARLPVMPWPFTLFRLDWHERTEMSSSAFQEFARSRPLVLLQGWFLRDEAALRKHMATIREFLAPVAAIREPVAAFLQTSREGVDSLVGVHVRQGDYATFRGGRYMYDTSVYRAVMARTAALLVDRSVRFVVCSDQQQDLEAFRGEGWDVVLGPGTALEDLYALAGCDYLVAPPSTYALWASFAGDVPLHLLERPDADFVLEDFDLLQSAFRNGDDDAVPVEPPRRSS